MFYHDRYDPFYYRATWRYKFCLFPKRCCETDELIWLKKAYLGQTTYFGPGDPVTEERWITDKQYIFMKLKGDII